VAAAAAAADDDDDEDQASLSDLCKQACVRRDRLAGWLLYDRAIPTHYALAVHAVSPCIVRVACETRWYHSLLRLNARAHCIMSPPPPSLSLSLSLSLYIYIYIYPSASEGVARGCELIFQMSLIIRVFVI